MHTTALANMQLTRIVEALDAINEHLGEYEQHLDRDLVAMQPATDRATSLFELRCLLANCTAQLDQLRSRTMIRTG